MDFSDVFNNIDLYLKGFGITIALTLSALSVGFVLAWWLAWQKYRQSVISPFVTGYIYYLRGTPALIQLYLVYYGLGQFEWVRESFLWPFFREPIYCAWFALMLNCSAYTAEIILGGLKTQPNGEIEAGKSLGLNNFQIFWLIRFVSTIRRILPSYSNETVFLMHATSLASSITVIELTRVARMINSKFYIPFEAFLTSAVFYFLLSYAMLYSVRLLERYLSYPSR